MSNRRQTRLSIKRGFTLVEMLIIAPIVILVIGIFVSAIITMTGDVLAVRGKNALAFNIQDALNRIDQDVKSSGGYLATNSFTLTSPQGYDDDIAPFKNAADPSIKMLILNTYATTANPLSSARNFVYATGPNACNSTSLNKNPKVSMNIIYFVKDDALWRRVIAPSNYATAGCSVPWQQPTCKPGYNPTTYPFCKTQDIKLVDGISASGFVLNYYTKASPNTPIVGTDSTDVNVRQTALQTASSINVTITATKTLAGRDVSQSGTIRSSSPNTGTTSNSLALSNSGGGTWAYKRPITITNSSGGALTNYQVQINPFTDSNFVNNTGLVGSWHLNEGSGTTVTDSSGNNNTGTINGANYWSASGKFNSAFSGTTNNYISTSMTGFSAAAGTVEMWIKPNQDLRVVSQGMFDTNPGAVGALRLWTNSNNCLYYDTGGSGGHCYTITSDWTGQWHHIVYEWSGTTTSLYVDGNSVGSSTNTYAPAISVFQIGRFNTANYFNGLIDEVKIYNRTLTTTEVVNRYGTSGSPKVRGDYADVRFANSTGATEYPYWQETDGKYWVKIPSLATGDTIINMYYGNSSATTLSNGANTFMAYSDYTDVGNWTGGGVSAVGSEIYVDKSGGVVATKPVSISGNWIVEIKYKRVTSTSSNLYFVIGNGSGSIFASNRNVQAYVDSGSSNWTTYNNGTPGTIYSSNTINNYYISKEVRHNSQYDHYIFDSVRSQLGSSITNTTYGYGGSADPIIGIQVGSGSSNWTSKVYIPWIIVRQYTSTEPTAALGTESAP